jgi:hypothetical protein
MEGAMHDLHRYRDSAAECLLAADEACQPYYRKLHLSMAASWLWMAASWLWLARQDEARPSKKGVLRHRTPLEQRACSLSNSAWARRQGYDRSQRRIPES